MRILIIYATNSSGTRVAAERIHDVLVESGHAVIIKRANAVEPDELGQHDLVILGSCSWERFAGKQRLEGQLQQHMFELAGRLQDKHFAMRKFAVFGLGDSGYTHFCGAVDHLVELVKQLGGKLVIEPLRIDGFFFRQEENEVRLAKWTHTLMNATHA
ncbi:MAG: flavodoxin family protein [Candidatus Kerfeldbacteria bacterium]|nr:flavodoxin family protein [Candidatus Kerfeldbacteria bacterium]